MFQKLITVAAGKRLIAKAIAADKSIRTALLSNTIVIIGGTTNSYIAEELLGILGVDTEFSKQRFFRGISLPPQFQVTNQGSLPNTNTSDVVIRRGEWQIGKTIFDVFNELKEGDIIFKGANTVNLTYKQAGVIIGHPQGGTSMILMQAVIGRRTRLIIPVGLEKRTNEDLLQIASMVNKPKEEGYRLFVFPNGEIITEIEALNMLTGVEAKIMAAGGVCGAEGAVWLVIRGSSSQEKKAREIIEEIENEPPFSIT